MRSRNEDRHSILSSRRLPSQQGAPMQKAGIQNPGFLKGRHQSHRRPRWRQGELRRYVRNAVDALNAGVRKVHFVDGRLPHALLLEIFTDGGVGTEVVR